MLCRFLGGVFGSAPLAIVGGALADFWGPVDRGIAICIFAGATFIGPVAGELKYHHSIIFETTTLILLLQDRLLVVLSP